MRQKEIDRQKGGQGGIIRQIYNYTIRLKKKLWKIERTKESNLSRARNREPEPELRWPSGRRKDIGNCVSPRGKPLSLATETPFLISDVGPSVSLGFSVCSRFGHKFLFLASFIGLIAGVKYIK